jgi:hypothetical protein
MAVLLLLTGCARGTPVGFRVAAGDIRYRPATPVPLSRDTPTGAESLAELEDAECGEPPEETDGAPTVRLELGEGEPLVFTPPPLPSVQIEETELREALAQLLLEQPLAVGRPPTSPPVLLAAVGDGAKVDGVYRDAMRWALWCQPGQSPREDGCLSLLERGLSMREYERVQMALGFALDTVWEGAAVGLRESAGSEVLWAMVGGFVASYVLMLAAPEPIFTKGLALVLTAYMVAWLGVGPFRELVLASRELVEASWQAVSFEELERAGHRFGRRLGENSARIVVLLVMASLGGKQGLLARGATLPGFGWAARLTSRQLRFQLPALELVHSIRITASGGLVIGLAPGAMAMAVQDPEGSAGRVALAPNPPPGTVQPGSSPPKQMRVVPLPSARGFWHHIATNKNSISTLRGGPWTPLFKRLFARAGMKLNDPANKVYIQGHKGPHPQAYHEAVYDRLRKALEDCTSTQQCRQSLTKALQELAREISTTGSGLNKLVTQ